MKFGSSGIRGPFGSEVTLELALALGRAVGREYSRVVVGRDARTSSPLLAQAVIAGLLAEGAEVRDAGVLPTPALAFGARNADCGVMITASHNPAPDNGFKLWNPDGSAFDAPQRARIEAALASPGAPRAGWRDLGAVTSIPDAAERHARAIVDLLGAPARKLRIVLDCGNGAACLESPRLLSALGHEVITLNAQFDGAFPGRPSEPNEKNLRDLAATVRATGADLGLAHDGDADRAMAATASGEIVSGDALLALFARDSKAKRVVVPCDTSRAAMDFLPGVDVTLTRVGDAYVSEAMKTTRAGWGGEPSGAWIFPALSYCPDGPLAAATLAAMVARDGPLDKLVAEVPRYPLARESFPVRDAAKSRVVEAVGRSLSHEGRVSALDGVRVDLDDGWILVRASGTEPKLRLTVEATGEAALLRLRERGRNAVLQALESER